MQRLNIPLHRYQHTTRLSRRVVSVFAVVACAGTVGALWAAGLWYGRDTTSAAAPEGTALVLHLNANRFTWGAVERALGSVTLVSDRPLTIGDVRGYTYGELSVFVSEDGTRSVAIRSTKAALPTRTLDALGILAQETSHGVYLLSSKPTARMDWKPGHVWFAWMHLPTSWHVGTLHILGENPLDGAVYASNSTLRIRFPKQSLPTIPWKSLPSGTVAALSTPALPNTDISGATAAIDTILSSYQTPSSADIASHVETSKGSILLRAEKDVQTFLIVSETGGMSREDQQKVIQTAAALQSPHLEPLPLPDNSAAQEIIVDPSLTTIEETTVAGNLVSRAATRGGGYLYTAERNGSFAITNATELLESWLKDEKKLGTAAECPSNVLYLNLHALLDLSKSALTSRTQTILSALSNGYGMVGVENKWFSTNIYLCR